MKHLADSVEDNLQIAIDEIRAILGISLTIAPEDRSAGWIKREFAIANLIRAARIAGQETELRRQVHILQSQMDDMRI